MDGEGTQVAEWLTDIAGDNIWDWELNQPQEKYRFLDPALGGTGWNWAPVEIRDRTNRLIAAPLPEEFIILARDYLPVERRRRWAPPPA